MPRFSIVIPAYKSAEYLQRCICSIANQNYLDWEAIIVVDGSPDNSLDVAKACARADDRVIVVNKKSNEGIHLARMTGVGKATGDYVFFLDADDEIHPGCLDRVAEVLESRNVDVLHVGINVIGVGISEEERSVFERYINSDIEPLSGPQVCAAAYSAEDGYRQDWRLTQRFYRRELIQSAFNHMVKKRLGRNEDGYEYFVVSCLAENQITRNNIVALDYYYGRGLNGTGLMSVDGFASTASDFYENLCEIERFSRSFSKFDTREFVSGSKAKAIDLLFNDWRNRVAANDQLEAARRTALILGADCVATQLMRLSRDGAYEVWDSGKAFDGSESFVQWYRLAEELISSEPETPSLLFREYRRAARGHIRDLEGRALPQEVPAGCIHPICEREYNSQSIRIFVTAHKNVDIFDSSVLQPVQVGSVLPRKRFLWALQDDEGENISELNAQYCELTTQYWAWKNAKADYYGFCHYRRYFDFSSKRHEENPYGEIMDSRIDAAAQVEYCLDDESIRRAVVESDVITTEVKDISAFPEKYTNVVDQYRRAPHLREEDLLKVVELLREEYPEYSEDIESFLSGHYSCFCNMFIMKRQLFFKYCEWLFPILERFVETWDNNLYSHEGLRTPGHLSERLLNIFLIHERRTNDEFRWKQVQCVHFELPDRAVKVALPALASAARSNVPIVLAADNTYVPMLTTTITSLLSNGSGDNFYDIVVLEKDISQRNQERMREFICSKWSNASIRFVNVIGYLSGHDLRTSNKHISVETYYRFLIQEVMADYDKVIYLDSDLVVLDDVAELIEIELEDNLLAATLDIDYLGNLNLDKGERLSYSKDVLKLKDPYGYFQAGVLVLNLAQLRNLHNVQEWLSMADVPQYIYDDQDILNSCCQGRVVYLDNSWNVMINCDGRIKRVFSYAPAAVFDSFMRAYSLPKIVHYAGYEKPWKSGGCDLDELYWRYARLTPFYERLIDALSTSSLTQYENRFFENKMHARAIGENNALRAFFDPLLPLGSGRREFAKYMVRKLRNRN